MARKLASIVEIASCDPIPDTERLSVAMMKGKGWRVVTGRDEFKPGDLAIYMEIDSFLPADDPRYEFLRERCLRKFVSKSGAVLREGIRIKSVKLRGVVSQGLLMPLDKFPEMTDCIVWSEDEQRDLFTQPSDAFVQRDSEGEVSVVTDVVGADVTALLHVEHYDEVAEQLRPATGGGNPIAADAMGKFPSDYIPKTDEERLANLTDWFKTMKGRVWQITAKDDGSSCTVFYSPTIDPENPFGVCSRNLRLKEFKADGTQSLMWRVVRKYGIPEKLKEFNGTADAPEYALQAELVGPGVNGDRDKYQEYELHVFRIWDIKRQCFLNPNDTVLFCGRFDIPHVQVLHPYFHFFDEIHTYDEAMELATGKTARGNEREGIVCKTVDDGPYASFKVVSERYLLKQAD